MKNSINRRLTAVLASGAALAGALVVGGAAPANAASSSCNALGAGFVLAGPRVNVFDSSSTYADSCFRLYDITGEGTNRIGIDYGVRDSAQDGQRAVTEVMFMNANYVWGTPKRLETTGIEADTRHSKPYVQNSVPKGVAFRVCRVTDAGTVNTCSGWYSFAL